MKLKDLEAEAERAQAELSAYMSTMDEQPDPDLPPPALAVRDLREHVTGQLNQATYLNAKAAYVETLLLRIREAHAYLSRPIP